jgi:hypothetical protein
MQDIWMASTNISVIFYRNPHQKTKAPGLSFQDFYDILQHQRDKPRTTCDLLVNYETQKFSRNRAKILQSIIADVNNIFLNDAIPADAQLKDLFSFNKSCNSKDLIEGACKYLDICVSCFQITDAEERKTNYCTFLISKFENSPENHTPDTDFFIYQDLFALYHDNQTKLWDAVSARNQKQKPASASAPTSGDSSPNVLSRPTSESALSLQGPPQGMTTNKNTNQIVASNSNKRPLSSSVALQESPRICLLEETKAQDSSDSSKLSMPVALPNFASNSTLSTRSVTISEIARGNQTQKDSISLQPPTQNYWQSSLYATAESHNFFDTCVDNQTSEVLSEVQPRKFFFFTFFYNTILFF